MALVVRCITATRSYPAKFSLRGLILRLPEGRRGLSDFDLTASLWCSFSTKVDLLSIAKRYFDLSPEQASLLESEVIKEVRSISFDVSLKGRETLGAFVPLNPKLESFLRERREKLFSKVQAFKSTLVPIEEALPLIEGCLKVAKERWRSFFTASDSKKIKILDSRDKVIEAQVSVFVLPELEEILKMFKSLLKSKTAFQTIITRDPKSGDQIEIFPEERAKEEFVIQRSGVGIILTTYTLFPKEKPLYEERGVSIMLAYRKSLNKLAKEREGREKSLHIVQKEKSLTAIRNMGSLRTSRSSGLGLIAASELYAKAREDVARWEKAMKKKLFAPVVGSVSLSSLLGIEEPGGWEWIKRLYERFGRDGSVVKIVEGLAKEKGINLKTGWEEEAVACFEALLDNLEWINEKKKRMFGKDIGEYMNVDVVGKVVKVDLRAREGVKVATSIVKDWGEKGVYYTNLEWVGAYVELIHSI